MNKNVEFMYFPKTNQIPSFLKDCYHVFLAASNEIASAESSYMEANKDKVSLNSNGVLEIVAPGLRELDYEVENGKREQIAVPVLYGRNGNPEIT